MAEEASLRDEAKSKEQRKEAGNPAEERNQRNQTEEDDANESFNEAVGRALEELGGN